MVLSQNEKYLGLLAGKNCIKEEEEIFQLFVYSIHQGDGQAPGKMTSSTPNSHFQFVAQVDLPSKYRKYSKTFCFWEEQVEKYILMIEQARIVKYNYIDEEDTPIYEF